MMNLEKVYKFKKNKYKIIKTNYKKIQIINFLTTKKKENFYNNKIFYKNYLNWLSKTLKKDLLEIRKEIFSDLHIKKNGKILIIGCGYGDEIVYLIKKFKLTNRIYAQDFSKQMIMESAKVCKNLKVSLTISDVSNLPYKNQLFDYVIQVGGFNQFRKKKKSMNEMLRVCKDNGTVFICDEGTGPWLKKTDIYRALINNNKLWSYEPPVKFIPHNTKNIKIGWILKNNFYYLKFKKSIKLEKINIDVIHDSPRGGSIRSRFENKYKQKINY